MEKSNMHKTLTLLTTATLLVSFQAQAKEESIELFSNMTPQAMNTLFRSVGYVNHKPSLKRKKFKQLTNFTWNTSKRTSISCSYFPDLGRHQVFSYDKNYIMRKAPHVRAKIPISIAKSSLGKTYSTGFRYTPQNGTLKSYYFNTRKNKWTTSRVGHLQKRIPAVVYKLCPKFPIAESLGAEINHKQTSDNYFELLKQDQGERIKRPELVTDDPVIRY